MFSLSGQASLFLLNSLFYTEFFFNERYSPPVFIHLDTRFLSSLQS